MRRARYDLQRVVCRNASCIGFSSNIAKPGYWVAFKAPAGSGSVGLARVLGRIAETDHVQSERYGECVGWLAVVSLHMEATHGSVRWVDPADVTACYVKPPAALLAWITGDEWIRNKGDIARVIAMSEHGTLGEDFISTRNDPDKAYNARPEYVAQFILKG